MLEKSLAFGDLSKNVHHGKGPACSVLYMPSHYFCHGPKPAICDSTIGCKARRRPIWAQGVLCPQTSSHLM